MSSEDIKKYGGFSLRYHRQMIGVIKASIAAIKQENKSTATKMSVRSVDERLLKFYDTLYELGLSEEDIAHLHSSNRTRGLIVFSLSSVILALSMFMLLIDDFSIFPNWVLSIATTAFSVALLVKGLTFNYYSWLIEQRLLPEMISFVKYLEKVLQRWPKKTLSATMLSEIKEQYKKRDDELRHYLSEDQTRTLEQIGLAHLMERLK